MSGIRRVVLAILAVVTVAMIVRHPAEAHRPPDVRQVELATPVGALEN